MVARRSSETTLSGSRFRLPQLRRPYLLFLADVTDALTLKTAFGLRDWVPQDVAGQWRLHPGVVDLGLPDLEPEQARLAGAGSLVIGAAPAGGQLPDSWVEALLRAARAGLDIVSGLHSSLADFPELVAAAAQGGATLKDIRRAPAALPLATGRRRSGKRLLTVGSDCAIGKKYAALAISREMAARGWPVDFRATGQTGLLIAGEGIVIDTVVADFIAGAAEVLSPDADPAHWDVIEGQGSLFHPAYAGVSLGLLHGSQPDAIVVCHDPLRREIDGCPGVPIPELQTAIQRNLEGARLTNPGVTCAGVSLNTSALSDSAARDALARVERDCAVPCVDPLRWGVGAIVDRLAPA